MKLNLIGQATRPRRLNRIERDSAINIIEAAINNGNSEARFFWTEDLKHIYGTSTDTGEKHRLSSPV